MPQPYQAAPGQATGQLLPRGGYYNPQHPGLPPTYPVGTAGQAGQMDAPARPMSNLQVVSKPFEFRPCRNVKVEGPRHFITLCP